MGIFNFWGSNKSLKSSVQSVNLYDEKISNDKYFGFSTPFGSIGTGNLTLPYVDKAFSGAGYVRFGSDNLYPQLLDQLYYMSAAHQSCINYKVLAIAGGGYTIDINNLDMNTKIDIKKFEKISKLDREIMKIVSDYVIHSRMVFKIYTKEGNIVKFERIAPSKVRTNSDRSKFITSEDWSRGIVNSKIYDNYEVDSNSDITILEWCKYSPGQDIYPIADYNSILNYNALDNDISFYMKNYLKNSVFFSGIITKKLPFTSDAEVNTYKKMFDSNKGSEHNNKLLFLTGSGGDDVPEYTPLSVSNNGDIFNPTTKLINEQIAIGHNMDPIILGVRIAGSLGQSSEQPFAYKKFEKLYVETTRKDIESAINYILDMAGISTEFKFNNYSIIDEDMINILNPTKSNNVSIEEEVEMTSEEKRFINEDLKGLSARDNMDIIRIVRDFNKGKLPYELAEIRLLSYGIDKVTIKNILKK
jgi:menaquinone-dependent protoporphyrinogen IX oxidase